MDGAEPGREELARDARAGITNSWDELAADYMGAPEDLVLRSATETR